jgi:FAD/FMN-containing dehydrogenase
VTVGGCIANDVHGKAHHVQGSFSACVDRMHILLASGEVVTASRGDHADLFWATFGGIGLLGIVLTATIRLRKIESTYFHQRAVHAKDLASMLAALEEYDQTYAYSVAYVDPVAKGARLGSGILTVGDHAAAADLPAKLAKNPLRVTGGPKLFVPFELPEFILNGLSIRMLNVGLKAMQGNAGAFAHYEKFFYPLDFVGEWNRGYGRRGFFQYQFVIPFENGLARLQEILTTIVSSGELPFLNVLKRFGKESGGLLSFPREGYTFAIDFPVRSHTVDLLRRLDAMVLDAGGRIYLGKDACLEADMFRAMYGKAVDDFLEVKAKYDPKGLFTSDQARRLKLV